MEMVKNAINWFEIPVTDFERAKRFYSQIFDFDMPVMEMGHIRMGILLSDQNEGVGGAICYGESYQPAGANGPKVYLNGGSDLNIVLSRVEAAGGQVIMPKGLISEEIGYMGFFNDTEGNVVALHSQH
ncbi:MAG: VOC family protein [Saprospiraceae bacterium]|nr:VOC family protein [Saprospiraceae bacterium]